MNCGGGAENGEIIRSGYFYAAFTRLLQKAGVFEEYGLETLHWRFKNACFYTFGRYFALRIILSRMSRCWIYRNINSSLPCGDFASLSSSFIRDLRIFKYAVIGSSFIH